MQNTGSLKMGGEARTTMARSVCELRKRGAVGHKTRRKQGGQRESCRWKTRALRPSSFVAFLLLPNAARAPRVGGVSSCADFTPKEERKEQLLFSSPHLMFSSHADSLLTICNNFG